MKKMITQCELCGKEADWSRNRQDIPVSRCQNDWCLLYRIEHIIGSPLPKVINQAAKSLGSLGGKKRKETTTLEQRQSWGKLGGRPRKIIN